MYIIREIMPKLTQRILWPLMIGMGFTGAAASVLSEILTIVKGE